MEKKIRTLFVGEEDLQRVKSGKVVTFLFGYRSRLFEAAWDDERMRGAIFEQRSKIADLFRKFGGEKHQGSVKQFEDLRNPDDLLKHAPSERFKRKEKQECSGRLGFYVVGNKLTSDQVRAIKAQNRTGKRVGRSRRKRLLDLLRLRDEVVKPIFINQPMSAGLQFQLAMLEHVRPELAEQLYVLNEEGGTISVKPYSSTGLVCKLTDREEEVAEEIDQIVRHNPEVGDIFRGKVRVVKNFGVYVEFLPGIDGLMHVSEFIGWLPSGQDCTDLLKVGQWVNVEVIGKECWGRAVHYRLSISRAEKKIAKGDQPLFAKVNQLLIGGEEEGETIDVDGEWVEER